MKKATTYKTAKGLVKAIRDLERVNPAKPIKGRGNERVGCAITDMLEVLIARGPLLRHVVTIYGRSVGKWGKAPASGYISPELDNILRANEQMVTELATAFRYKQLWDSAIA